MNKNAKKWVKALRSGKYKQNHQDLLICEDDEKPTYCVLGVATKLAEDSGIQVNWNYTTLTPEVTKWLGLDSETGLFEPVDGVDNLIGLNDGLQWGFQKLATFIESEPKGLFKPESKPVTRKKTVTRKKVQKKVRNLEPLIAKKKELHQQARYY